MQCTRHVYRDGKLVKCGNETGKPCPPMWIKHQRFDPQVVWIFFTSVVGQPVNGVTMEDLATLDAFVCHECMPGWEKNKRGSLAGQDGAATRRNNKSSTTDYSI